MTSKLTAGAPALASLVERQMRNWEIARAQRPRTPSPQRREVEDFLCVSRMVGVDHRAVAAGLGERLGWPVFDREILDAMAGDDELRRRIYASMDQKDLNWWEAALRPFVQRGFVRDDYFHRLCETLLSLARQGTSVFVGRGADLVLPRDRGFRVRLVAPRTSRLERFAAERRLTPADAEHELELVERQRAEFIRHHFGIEVGDPLRHDLTINLARLGPQAAVKLILRARELAG